MGQRVALAVETSRQKNQGRRALAPRPLFDHLRALSGDRARWPVPRVLLLGLVLDHPGALVVRNVHHGQRDAQQLFVNSQYVRSHSERRQGVLRDAVSAAHVGADDEELHRGH